MCFKMLEGLLLVWIFTVSPATSTPFSLDGDGLDRTKIEKTTAGYGHNSSDYDNEIHVDKYGIFIGIKYLDLTTKSKGARADVRIEDLNKLFPVFKMGLVKLSYRFDNGDNSVDNLFEIVIDYKFHSSNTEKGTVKIVRTKDGKIWTTKLSLISKVGPDLKVTPDIEISLKTIYKTKDQENPIQPNLDMILKKMYFNINGKLNSFNFWFMEKNPDERFVKIDAEYNGKKYKFHTDWDFEHELDLDFTFNLGGTTDYKFWISGDDLEFKDFEVRAIKRIQNKKILYHCRSKYDGGIAGCWSDGVAIPTLLTSSWKGNVNYGSKSVKYVVDYELPAMNATGELEFDAKFKPEMKLEIDLKHMLDTKQELKFKVFIGDQKTDWMMMKEEEHHFHYTLLLDYELQSDLNMEETGIDKNSPFKDMLCYDCGWKRVTMPFNILVNKNNMFNVLLEAKLVNQNNDTDIFNITLDTRVHPNKLSFYAPGNPDFGPNVTGSIVASNIDFFKYLVIDNVGNETINIEYKEMELLKIEYSLTNKTQTLQHPPGSHPSNMDGLKHLLKQNKMKMTLQNSTIMLIAEWDITSPHGLIHIIFGDEADFKIIYRDGGWNFQISQILG